MEQAPPQLVAEDRSLRSAGSHPIHERAAEPGADSQEEKSDAEVRMESTWSGVSMPVRVTASKR